MTIGGCHVPGEPVTPQARRLGDTDSWPIVHSLNDAKSFKDDGGVVLDRERGITERLPHFVAVPTPLVCDPPFGNGGESLRFVNGVTYADIAERDHGDTCDLNDRDRPVVRVNHHRSPAGYWEWSAVQIIFPQKTRRRDLLTTEHSGHQRISQRPRECKLSKGQVLVSHAAHGTAGCAPNWCTGAFSRSGHGGKGHIRQHQ